jgi:molecular chaperone DnaK
MGTNDWTSFTRKLDATEVLIESDRSDDLVLGIDLGTSNSAACCVVDDKPVMIDLRSPDEPAGTLRSLPSVVAFDDASSSMVGMPALRQLPTNPKRTLIGTKRFIGRQYDSPTVQSMLPFFPYRVVPGTGGTVAVEINGRVKPLAVIAAYILKAIHQRAEAQIKRPIGKVVVTVPAYYNDNQRDAVMQAGRLAGLNVISVLNEPTAAAIAYGLKSKTPRTFLVYDLGGGTFDVSVMRSSDETLRVLATAGDTFLGGEDFDSAILTDLIERYEYSSGNKLSRNATSMAALKLAVEQAKRRLSVHEQTQVVCKDIPLLDRSRVKVEMPVTRAGVERVVKPLVGSTLRICERALQAVGLKVDQVDEVILCGGQTLMPCVRDAVKAFFGKAPRCDINPDEAVALGAGLMPHLSRLGTYNFRDVLSMSIGVAVGNAFQPVIEKNTQVPYRRTVNVKVAAARLKGYTLQLYQGESAEAHKNERLGALPLDVVRPGALDPVPIAIDFLLTKDCRLELRVTNVETGEACAVFLDTRLAAAA